MGSAGNVGYPVTIDDNRLPCHVIQLEWIGFQQVATNSSFAFRNAFNSNFEREKNFVI